MLVDAYHSKRVLPLYVVQLLDGLTFPCFIAALICVDRVLSSTMRFGRPQQRPRDRLAIEGVGVVAYFILSVVLYTRASLVPHFRSWIVVVQAVFVTWSLVLFFMLVGSVKRICSMSSKVIDFGTNRKRVCDFLLVRLSNLGPILYRFRDIVGFCAHHPTPIPPLFWGCYSSMITGSTFLLSRSHCCMACTQYDRLFALYCRLSVCLSVCL